MSDSLSEILEKYPLAQRDNLIQILQDIQENIGYLTEESVKVVGEHLNLPASKIYGLATFYNQFRFEPHGKFHIQLCRGTACHVMGSERVLSQLEKELGISSGQITRDGLFSIELLACIGACGQAPVISINGEFYTGIDSERLKAVIQELKAQEV